MKETGQVSENKPKWGPPFFLREILIVIICIAVVFFIRHYFRLQ